MLISLEPLNERESSLLAQLTILELRARIVFFPLEIYQSLNSLLNLFEPE
jgi:hypothetical protein